jgi:DNA invertase Pin-like site-specific DNA recombinase
MPGAGRTGTGPRGPGKTVVYVRQSTNEQVERNTGSRDYQLAQVEIARTLGYSDDRIELVDEDLGRSGSASDHRPGYQRMVRMIENGEVDLVIASDATRISRDTQEWLRFLFLCAIHNVKLHLDGKLMDPKNGDERFVTGLIAMAGEYDNWRRRETMAKGRLAKLKERKAVSRPPAGYVWGQDGQWLKDERPRVQDSIKAHFRAVREARSLRKAVRLLREWDVETPRQRPKGAIAWIKPKLHALQQMVHNPAYVGDVAYGRHRIDPLKGRDGRGRWRLAKAREEDVVHIRDHHEPYVSRDEWREIHDLLERNAWSESHGIVGPGNALAQGSLRCTKHRMWLMRAVHKSQARAGLARYVYICTGDVFEGGPQCGRIPGWVVDTPLRAAVINRLTPQSLDELRHVMRQAEADVRSEGRRRRDELHGLRQEVEDLQFRYERVDPNHWAVATGLEEKLEQKKRELLRRERDEAAGCTPGILFDEDCFEELKRICKHLDALLDAPTTSGRDRKELVRIMVDRIMVEERTRERVRLRIVWRDGPPDTIREVLLFPYAHHIIRDMLKQGADAATIATRLNEVGVSTKYRTSWTTRNVDRQVRRLRSRR